MLSTTTMYVRKIAAAILCKQPLFRCSLCEHAQYRTVIELRKKFGKHQLNLFQKDFPLIIIKSR